jgi:hypothetical protein
MYHEYNGPGNFIYIYIKGDRNTTSRSQCCLFSKELREVFHGSRTALMCNISLCFVYLSMSSNSDTWAASGSSCTFVIHKRLHPTRSQWIEISQLKNYGEQYVAIETTVQSNLFVYRRSNFCLSVPKVNACRSSIETFILFKKKRLIQKRFYSRC